MIRLHDGLEAVRGALEGAMQAAAPRPDAPYVVLGNPAEANAKYGETSKGRFLATVAGLHPATALRAAPVHHADGVRPPPASLEVSLLLTADFPGQYPKGVRMMAAALDWIYDDAVLVVGESRLTVALVELGVEEAAALVEMAGVKGCPFALLRLRGLSAGGSTPE